MASQTQATRPQPGLLAARSFGAAARRSGMSPRVATPGPRRPVLCRPCAAALEDDSTFGKPQAPKELWQGFSTQFRAQFLTELKQDPSKQCGLRAGLYIAGEDDAIATRTAVCLPVEPYVQRVETMVSDIACAFADASPAEPADFLSIVDFHLYTTMRYRVPTSWDERFSPYRTYVHNVLAQRVGVAAALASIHSGVLTRLRASGALPFEAEVVLPPGGARPFARPVAGAGGAAVGAVGTVGTVGTVATPEVTARATLEGLKRAFWAWEWPQDAPSGFLAAARAAAGENGRMGTALAGTVMQPTGRPFGDLERAALATERLLALDGGGGIQQRDLGVLAFHRGSHAEAYKLLKAFAEGPAGRAAQAALSIAPLVGAGASLAGDALGKTAREDQELLEALLLRLERMRLESTWRVEVRETPEIE